MWRNLSASCRADQDFVSWSPYLAGMRSHMELRHLRYFVAVAEEGSLTVAAEQRLHTAQPSLSRQMRDLEYQVGPNLIPRSARGSGRRAAAGPFLVHGRRARAKVKPPGEPPRGAANL